MSVSHIPADLRRLVRERAGDCCEYCGVPQVVTLISHQIDHVVAEKHGGPTNADNLALSCALCNAHKGSDVASFDPATGLLAALFHPRRERWLDHFRFDGDIVEGLTPVGRATVRLLQLNHPDRVAERRILLAAGALNFP